MAARLKVFVASDGFIDDVVAAMNWMFPGGAPSPLGRGGGLDGLEAGDGGDAQGGEADGFLRVLGRIVELGQGVVQPGIGIVGGSGVESVVGLKVRSTSG